MSKEHGRRDMGNRFSKLDMGSRFSLLDMGNKLTLSVFSLSHLVVDCACFFVLMGAFFTGIGDLQTITIGFLLYTAIAFALQVLIGYLADRCSIPHGYFAVAGCCMVILGVILPVSPWTRLVLCALGNGFFHIGGGIDSLVDANGRFARSGIFISFGAIGVVVGTLLGKEESLSPVLVSLLVSLVLFSCIVLMLKFCLQPKKPYEALFNHPPARVTLSEAVIYLCLLTIIIRAVVGAYTPVPWKSSTFLFILPALTVFAGKFAGGLLADRFGAKAVASVSLLISAPLLAFGNAQIVLCCIGLFLFNVTTAVTLCVVVSRLPQNPGLGFGLTTLALFIGTAFSYFFGMSEGVRPVLTLVAIAISVICIFLTTPGRTLSGKTTPNKLH